MQPKRVSIWYIIGLQLALYGVVIMGAGIYEWFVPPDTTLVLANLHAGIWWGAIMLTIGIFYIVRFNPKKHKELT